MTYVISDLHGWPFESFLALLDKAGFSEEDTLYILGDVIDRGQDGVKYLLWLPEQKNVLMVRGNHEEMMLSCRSVFHPSHVMEFLDERWEMQNQLYIWKANGANPTIKGLKQLNNEQRLKIRQYVRRTPLYREITVGDRNYVLVHSGFGNFDPQKPLEAYEPDDLLWYRPTLDDRYFEDKMTIFGHTPTLFYGEQYAGQIIITDTWIDIDAGAAAGYAPVLLRLDDGKTFS